MPPNAQHEVAPASFAPRRREVTCFHEAGHCVIAVLLVGSIGGVRINPDGSGMMWRGPTPKADAGPANEERWRERFAGNETLLFENGPVPAAIVNQHFAAWRNEAIIALGGQIAERLAFGVVVSLPNSDQLSAKTFTRRCSVGRAGANALLAHCASEARTLLEKYWAAVEAVAKLLDREGELDGETVARLIAETRPPRSPSSWI
jgi:Peptidase M50B-like